jgi:hypothetical protein
MIKTIRSRSNMSVLDAFDDKWKIVAKRTIAEPTPRTQFQPPRFGIYEYDLVPTVTPDSPERVSAQRSAGTPSVAFRKVRS